MKMRENYRDSCLLSEIPWFVKIFITIMGSALTYILLAGGFSIPITFFTAYLLSFIVVGCIIGVVIGVVIGAGYLFNFIKNKTSKTRNKALDNVGDVVDVVGNVVEKISNSWFIQGIISFKQRTCKIITYK